MFLLTLLIVACSATRIFPEYREMLKPDDGWKVVQPPAHASNPVLSFTVALKQPGAKVSAK